MTWIYRKTNKYIKISRNITEEKKDITINIYRDEYLYKSKNKLEWKIYKKLYIHIRIYGKVDMYINKICI